MPDAQYAAIEPTWPPASATPRQAWHRAPPPLRIGLLNNMRGRGFHDADRQFRTLLTAASEGADVATIGYVLATQPLATQPLATQPLTTKPLTTKPWANLPDYRSADAIDDDAPDGLIITGAEPCAADLRDEAYYPALTRVIDRAIRRHLPIILSCLASHAAVLHLTGIRRRRLAHKCHGILRFAVQDDQAANAPIAVPHSRWNSLDEAALVARGYRVLTASPRWGVDRFAHPDAPGCLFLQGHPEYETGTLALEYRRDVRRYLARQADHYPTLPVGYFDTATRNHLRDFAHATARSRDPTMMTRLPAAPPAPPSEARWRPSAIALYRTWLDQVARRATTAIDR